MRDFEQCLNWLQLDLISLLVNFMWTGVNNNNDNDNDNDNENNNNNKNNNNNNNNNNSKLWK